MRDRCPTGVCRVCPSMAIHNWSGAILSRLTGVRGSAPHLNWGAAVVRWRSVPSPEPTGPGQRLSDDGWCPR